MWESKPIHLVQIDSEFKCLQQDELTDDSLCKSAWSHKGKASPSSKPLPIALIMCVCSETKTMPNERKRIEICVIYTLRTELVCTHQFCNATTFVQLIHKWVCVNVYVWINIGLFSFAFDVLCAVALCVTFVSLSWCWKVHLDNSNATHSDNHFQYIQH